MEIWELIAREQIRDLVARYNATADVGRFEETLSLFAADASMTTPLGHYDGIDDMRRIFADARGAVAVAAPARGRPHVRHHTSTHTIEVIDEGRATGRCYFAVLTPAGLDHWGRYVDEYVAVDGRWLFGSRRVTVDGQREDSVFPDSLDT